MSDLIRRMDAVQACQVGPSDEWSQSTKSGYNQAATDCAMNILRIPAVQPDLTDPVVVHANMLRGTIAKPTLDQIIHLYGVDALCRALVPVISREAALDEMARLGQEFDAALKGESHE